MRRIAITEKISNNKCSALNIEWSKSTSINLGVTFVAVKRDSTNLVST